MTSDASGLVTSDEGKRYAAQCVLVAEQTNDPAVRLGLLEMAQVWIELADLAEKNSRTDLVYETPDK